MDKITLGQVAKMIDHSLLAPTLTEKELHEGCNLALKLDVASCCVKPYHTKLTSSLLDGSDVLTCAVVGFPHGNSVIDIKKLETARVIQDGATEVDMVINISKAIEEDWEYLEQEIHSILSVTRTSGAILKVIFATDFLSDHQVIQLCHICGKLEVDFIKTSTGYNYKKDKDGTLYYEGATTHVLSLMRKHAPSHVQVKAAGACSTLERLLEVRRMGITRIGTGQTATIIADARKAMNPEGFITY